MNIYGGRVSQSCLSFQNFVDNLQQKIILLQPLLLLNYAVVGNVDIQPYQIKYMGHVWHPTKSAPKRMTRIINQLVRPIYPKHTVVVIIYGSGNWYCFLYSVTQYNSIWFLLSWFTLGFFRILLIVSSERWSVMIIVTKLLSINWWIWKVIS